MASIFSKIIKGEIPSYKIAETEYCYAFLDINPVRKGHVLVVPKTEVDKFFDQSNTILTELVIFSKRIAQAMEKCFDCNRIGMTVIGLEVPHAHVHLIPINTLNDMDFGQERVQLSNKEFLQIADKISANLI